MKCRKLLSLAFAATLGVVAVATGQSAFAHGRVHFGFNIGVPIVPYYAYRPPVVVYAPPPAVYYSAPPPVMYSSPSYVINSAAPSTYMQSSSGVPNYPSVAPPVAPQQGAGAYYCNNPDGYYPYVKDCPQGWQVMPAPSSVR